MSIVEKGGVAGAEFSTDVTFSQWFCFLISLCLFIVAIVVVFIRKKYSLAGQNTEEFGRF